MSEKGTEKKYDLEERTAKFGEKIIDFTKGIKRTEQTRPLINQLVRAGTSIGANYCEADCAESRKDFIHKISLCKKEAKECRHWLRMLARAVPEKRDEIEPLWQEAKELQFIFISIAKSSRENSSSF